MNQQDKNYAESICRVIQVLPADKREYLRSYDGPIEGSRKI